MSQEASAEHVPVLSSEPKVDLDDPNTLTDEDYVNFYQFKPLAVDYEGIPQHLKEADEKLMSGQFWEAHKMVYECLECAGEHLNCAYSYVGIPPGAFSDQADERLLQSLKVRFFELEVERARRIKSGEPDGVLPRSSGDRKSAEEIVAEKKTLVQTPGTVGYHSAYAIRYFLHGEFGKAANYLWGVLKAALNGGAPSNHPEFGLMMVQLYSKFAVAVFALFRKRQFRIIQHILENEGEDIMCATDPILKKIMFEQGSIPNFIQPDSVHARHIRKYLLRFIDVRDRERAVRLCKRYLIIQRLYDDEDWADLPVKIQQTEQLLNELQYGSLENLKNVEQTLRVSVSVDASPGTASPRPPTPSGPGFNMSAFLQEQLPGEEPDIPNPKGTIANYRTAEGVESLFVECKSCGEFMSTVPKLLPSAGFIAGMVISGMFAPLLIGIIPFAYLSVKQPCHYVQHYCSQCSAPIEN